MTDQCPLFGHCDFLSTILLIPNAEYIEIVFVVFKWRKYPKAHHFSIPGPTPTSKHSSLDGAVNLTATCWPSQGERAHPTPRTVGNLVGLNLTHCARVKVRTPLHVLKDHRIPQAKIFNSSWRRLYFECQNRHALVFHRSKALLQSIYMPHLGVSVSVGQG